MKTMSSNELSRSANHQTMTSPATAETSRTIAPLTQLGVALRVANQPSFAEVFGISGSAWFTWLRLEKWG